MGETSQSRYSIVERLTKQKLDLMSAKSNLKEYLAIKEQQVIDKRNILNNWKKDVLEDNKRQERGFLREADEAKDACTAFAGRMKDTERVYDEKIKAVDEALKRIEDISKLVPNP